MVVEDVVRECTRLARIESQDLDEGSKKLHSTLLRSTQSESALRENGKWELHKEIAHTQIV